MKILQNLEQLEGQHAPHHHVPVQLMEETCQSCMCVHTRIALVAGVDDPLQRDHTKISREYRFHQLDTPSKVKFRQAMDKEWQSFLDLKVVTVVPAAEAKQIPKERILPTRFILTNKDDIGKTLISKARLVCGGHLDQDINLLRPDAPTADTMGVNLVFLLAASYKWVLQGGDTSTACCQVRSINRSLYLRPPKEGIAGSPLWGFTGNAKRGVRFV